MRRSSAGKPPPTLPSTKAIVRGDSEKELEEEERA